MRILIRDTEIVQTRVKLGLARPGVDTVHIAINRKQDLYSTARLQRSVVFPNMID